MDGQLTGLGFKKMTFSTNDITNIPLLKSS